MNTHSHEQWPDDETWQRVVDNDLTAEELKELFAACDQHPELWRCCALAFLEEQALRSELKQLASQWQEPFAQAQSARETAPMTAREDDHVHRTHEKASIAQPAASPGAPLLNTLALAASIALSFLVGWQASRRMTTDSDRSAITAGGPAGAASNSAPPGPAERHAPQQLLAQERNVGSDRQMVGTASAPGSTSDVIQQALLRSDQFVPIHRRVPKPLADLEQRGLVHIESMEGFVPVQLNDGNTALVPVQQYDVRSIDNAY